MLPFNVFSMNVTWIPKCHTRSALDARVFWRMAWIWRYRRSRYFTTHQKGSLLFAHYQNICLYSTSWLPIYIKYKDCLNERFIGASGRPLGAEWIIFGLMAVAPTASLVGRIKGLRWLTKNALHIHGCIAFLLFIERYYWVRLIRLWGLLRSGCLSFSN